MKRTLLLIPANNEAESIGTLLDKLTCPEILEQMDILVIDDASTDATPRIVQSYPVDMITQVINQGYGAALQLGYKYAAHYGYDYVIQMDADGQHDACNVGTILQALTTPDSDGVLPDIVLGSRFLPGSQTFPIPWVKQFSIRFFRWLIRLITGTVVLDPTSGLQGLNRRTFCYYAAFRNFDTVYPDANVLIQMLMLGYHLQEIPSIMHEREAGTSMHSGFLKPLLYMMIMPLSIFSVWLRLRRHHNT